MRLLAMCWGLATIRRRPRHGRAAVGNAACLVGHSHFFLYVGLDYWITSSARASTAGGIVRPRAFAVLRLMTHGTASEHPFAHPTVRGSRLQHVHFTVSQNCCRAGREPEPLPSLPARPDQ
jgi:hypothetical protein